MEYDIDQRLEEYRLQHFGQNPPKAEERQPPEETEEMKRRIQRLRTIFRLHRKSFSHFNTAGYVRREKSRMSLTYDPKAAEMLAKARGERDEEVKQMEKKLLELQAKREEAITKIEAIRSLSAKVDRTQREHLEKKERQRKEEGSQVKKAQDTDLVELNDSLGVDEYFTNDDQTGCKTGALVDEKLEAGKDDKLRNSTTPDKEENRHVEEGDQAFDDDTIIFDLELDDGDRARIEAFLKGEITFEDLFARAEDAHESQDHLDHDEQSDDTTMPAKTTSLMIQQTRAGSKSVEDFGNTNFNDSEDIATMAIPTLDTVQPAGNEESSTRSTTNNFNTQQAQVSNTRMNVPRPAQIVDLDDLFEADENDSKSDSDSDTDYESGSIYVDSNSDEEDGDDTSATSTSQCYCHHYDHGWSTVGGTRD